MSDFYEFQGTQLSTRSQHCSHHPDPLAPSPDWSMASNGLGRFHSFSIPQPIASGEPAISTTTLPSASWSNFDLNTLQVGRWPIDPANRRLTFSFVTPQTARSYPTTAIPPGSEVQPVSAIVQTYVRTIFNGDQQGLLGLYGLSHFLNLQFEEVPETVQADGSVQAGDIRIMYALVDNNSFYARANSPGNYPAAGDVYLNPNNPTNSGGREEFHLGPNSIGYETLIHEIGHALGLKHVGNYDGNGQGTPPFLPEQEDNLSNTLMSYNYGGTFPSTFMPYDIRALQGLYGANQNFNSQDSYYAIAPQNLSMKRTLWDAGGTDTLDFSALSADASGYYLDLREGGSSKSMSDREAVGVYRYGNPVMNNGVPYTVDRNGFSIAFGVVIEHVIGSSSNDSIYGNSANNDIVAGDGNDRVIPGVGRDRIVLGNGNDVLVIQPGSGGYTPDTADVVYDFVQGTDVIGTSGFTVNDLYPEVVGQDTYIRSRNNGEYLLRVINVPQLYVTDFIGIA